MNKETMFTYMMCTGSVFSIIFFMFFLINSIFWQKFWFYTITLGIFGFVSGIIFLKSLSDWNFEPWNKPLFQKFFFIQVITLIIILPLGFYHIQYDALQEWNNLCAKKGLQNKCTPIDECTADCNGFEKQYYKFEGGGIFDDDNCWCKTNDKTEQIW